MNAYPFFFLCCVCCTSLHVTAPSLATESDQSVIHNACTCSSSPYLSPSPSSIAQCVPKTPNDQDLRSQAPFAVPPVQGAAVATSPASVLSSADTVSSVRVYRLGHTFVKVAQFQCILSHEVHGTSMTSLFLQRSPLLTAQHDSV